MKKNPQILLLGNGLNLAYGGTSWADLLKDIACRDDLPLDELQSPMPLQAILVTNNNIKKGLKKQEKPLYGTIKTKEQSEALRRVLKMGFDHILTTNYSYELEMACREDWKVTDNYLKKISHHTEAVNRVEPKYLLHTYNECNYEGATNKIWHVHGEARKQDSMILGHYYYASLLCKMKSEIDSQGNKYLKNQMAGKLNEVESWMDAFILGDVYILGLGFDFSELDLWWLLNRKLNEDAEIGRVYYFAPKSPVLDEKAELLNTLGVDVRHCDVIMPKHPGEDATEEQKQEYKKFRNEAYSKFYPLALDKIEELLSKNSK